MKDIRAGQERETTRAQAVERAIADAPASAQKLTARAFSGAASPRAAIKAQCLACTGYDRSAILNCTGWTCPLWMYRPFQKASDQAEGK